MVILLSVDFPGLIHLFIFFIVMKRLNRIAKSIPTQMNALNEISMGLNGAKGICISLIYVIINKNQRILNKMSEHKIKQEKNCLRPIDGHKTIK